MWKGFHHFWATNTISVQTFKRVGEVGTWTFKRGSDIWEYLMPGPITVVFMLTGFSILFFKSSWQWRQPWKLCYTLFPLTHFYEGCIYPPESWINDNDQLKLWMIWKKRWKNSTEFKNLKENESPNKHCYTS